MRQTRTEVDYGQFDMCCNDRDAKFCASFDSVLKTGGVNAMKLPVRSPNLNTFAERWVRSVKQECLSRLILFEEASLKRAGNGLAVSSSITPALHEYFD
jgi:hypothetical protein